MSPKIIFFSLIWPKINNWLKIDQSSFFDFISTKDQFCSSLTRDHFWLLFGPESIFGLDLVKDTFLALIWPKIYFDQ
jgi:hypothetical protein